MRIEGILGTLVLVASIAWRLALAYASVEVELWQVVTWTGAAFLAIGLVRDVVIRLTVERRPPARAGEKLICFESAAGALLVAAGLALLALDVHRAFLVAQPTVASWAGALLIASGLTKDVVMVFKREKNHANIIPW
jgi:hypothetical protein